MLLIVGATGNIGRHLVPLLQQAGIPFRVLSRDAKRAAAILTMGVDIIQADLTHSEEISAALSGVDQIFLATNGADQVDGETNLIQQARDTDVQHIVKVSVIDARPDHFVMLAQAHAAIEQQLKESGIPATILRPNWFNENFLGAADTIQSQGAIYGSAGEGKVAFIDSRDTAAVAASILTGTGHTGKSYQLTGPQALTFSEAAQQLSVGLGRTVRYVDLTEGDFRNALLGAGLPNMMADIFLQINRNARENNLSQVTSTVADLTGHAPRTLETFARDYRSVLSPTAQ